MTLLKSDDELMMMMQHRNCAVKSDKVQTDTIQVQILISCSVTTLTAVTNMNLITLNASIINQ